MRIVITHSYFLRYDTKQWSLGKPYPPLGTLYATSTLVQAGHDVAFVDSMFFESPSQISKALSGMPDLFIIYDDGFNYLTKMCLTNMRQAAFEMVGLAKLKGARIIVSSSDSTDHYQEYLEAGADYVLLGEGERTLIELLGWMEGSMDTKSGGLQSLETSLPLQVAGLAFRNGDNLIRTATRRVIRNLDQLPLPAWSSLNIEPYRERWLSNAGYFSLNIGTTRGCPYKCNWCAKPIYGNRYNARSASQVVEELILLKKQFGFDHVWFCDDIFGLKPGWVEEFARLVSVKQLKFRFKIQSRADLLIDESYVSALARAGCEEIWMGAESGSQKILDAMDKGIQVEQVKVATMLLKKYRIRPCFFIQIWLPWRNKE